MVLTLGQLVKDYGEDEIVVCCLTEDDVDLEIEKYGEDFTDEMREEVLRRGFNYISGLPELVDICDDVYSQMSQESHQRIRCNECGCSVKAGSGNYVNRVIDFNTPEERKEMGKRFPKGDYMCRECDAIR